MGVIDTLSAGFDRVTRRLWLILVPALLDIGIWSGPKLSIHAISRGAAATLSELIEPGTPYQQSLELTRDWLTRVGAETNLLSMLSMRILGLPSLTGAFTPKTRLFATAQRVVEIRTWPALLGLGTLFTLLSLLMGCLCLSWIAQEARDEELNWAYALQVTARSWVRVLALALLIAMALASLMIGVGFMYAMLAVLSPQLGALMLSFFGLGFLWLSVYAGIILFFTPRAMILDNMGIFHSLWSSLNVVHRNFFSVVAFVLLVNVIQTGLLYIWRVMTGSAVGTLVGVLGNAYVSTGLVMSSFIFYRDQFVAWQEATTGSKTGAG